jgi:ligand-binding sensor domain-containing protein
VWYSNWSAAGVYRFDGESEAFYTTDEILAGKEVLSIAVAPDGTCWFGTRYGGIVHFDGENWSAYTVKDGWPGFAVADIAVTTDGTLWLATWQGGVFRFTGPAATGPTGDGGTWVNHTVDDGLASITVLCIAVAPDGALWFGTQRGASRFDGQTWTTYTPDDGLAGHVVRSIAVGLDGALWFGTDEGVSRFTGPAATGSAGDGEAWVTFTVDDGLADNIVYSIAAAADGTLWFGTEGGVSRYRPRD